MCSLYARARSALLRSRPALVALTFGLVVAPASAQPNDPPVPSGIADGDVIEVTVDQVKTINFSFTSPEAGQTTTITLTEVVADDFPGFFDLTTTPGNPATAEAEFSAFNGTGGTAVGDYDFVVEACDDGPDGGACTTLGITVRLAYPPTKTCDFGVRMYINEFSADADPANNYFQIYSEESGLVDLSTCSLVAFDGLTEQIVVSEPLDYTLFPFAEPEQYAGVDFTGMIPEGPGAIALVRGTPSLGDVVASVLGDVVNAIVYYNDGDFTFDTDSIFGICGEGTLLGGAVPSAPCDSSVGSEALAEALARLGQAVAVDGDPEAAFTLDTAPNPLATRGTVTLDLAEAADVRVALYDALGRQVTVVAEGPLGPGRHTAALDASALPAGVYVVRATAGAETRTAPLTVVR